jgi:hypothetical protein
VSSVQGKLPQAAHTTQPWRIHELTRDFDLEDVWQLPALQRPEDFPRMVQMMASLDPSRSASPAVRTLFAIRWKLGGVLGLDRPAAGLDARVRTLRDRLPQDLRDGPRGPEFAALPFRPLYLLPDEWAAEIANRTMHGVLHLGMVADEAGALRAQMAVYVRRNGALGRVYMAAIRPFRYRIVYPAALRANERQWQALTGAAGDQVPVIER